MNTRAAVLSIKRAEVANIEASKLLMECKLAKLKIWKDALTANRLATANREIKHYWRQQEWEADHLKDRIVSDHWNRKALALLWAARAIRKVAPGMLAKRHIEELRDWDSGTFLDPPTPENVALHRKCLMDVRTRGTAGEQRYYSTEENGFRQRLRQRMGY